MQDFRKLKVWEKAHKLTLKIYKQSSTFPKEELFGLTSQLRRSTHSIPTNIAEGAGRGSGADFARFIQIAMGSACETEYLLLLCCDLQFYPKNEYENLNKEIIEIKKMLTALIKRLRADH